MGAKRGTMKERLDRGIDRSGGPDACWPWMGALNSSGYGVIREPSQPDGRDGRAVRTHRVTWQEYRREALIDLYVLHTCDNRRCCNPAHLWLGTHLDNMQDMRAKGRSKGEACPRAKLTETEVRAIRTDSRTNAQLSRDLGIPESTIWSIRARRSWQHLD